jgi:hypothetical protein
MSTLSHSDSLLNDYVAMFQQLEPTEQVILLGKLNYSLEKTADPAGVEAARQICGAWGGEENREDVEQMLRAIAENRTQEREVKI